MKIAIIGNPNAGKTTLFNALTGAQQRVGNWPGVTVERKTGSFTLGGNKVSLVDLPGIYDLEITEPNRAIDETIARDYILSKDADYIINVVDAVNLERNLYLTLQLLELGAPVIVALNMIDIAEKEGIDIDVSALEKSLNVPVVPLVARKKRGITALKNKLIERPCLAEAVSPVLTEVRAKYDILAKAAEEDPELMLPEARYQTINYILEHAVTQMSTVRSYFTQKLDKIVLNRFLGLPIFFLLMYLMFEFSITFGGALQPLFDDGSNAIFVAGVNHLGGVLHIPLWITAILAEGLGLGINTVITFVPQIATMFLFLSFIEDSGYMSRAAFVMDRVLRSVGLPGKAFIPLIIGFGCNVPAIMATRTLDNRRDRLLTIMMSPFMSCGARLAIFAIFANSFFPRGGGTVVFLLYIIGILVALLTGFIMRGTLLKGEVSHFIMEIPPYHMPHFKGLVLHTWQKTKGFVWRAGKVIVPICLLVGSLNSIDWHGQVYPEGSPNSVLATVSKAITPAFAPMGVTQQNWPATVGLVTGTLAKEVVVGTLNTLYNQGNTASDDDADAPYSFWGSLAEAAKNTWTSVTSISRDSFVNPFAANEANANMSQASMGNMVAAFGSVGAAFSYMLFVLLYVPCVSAIAATNREAGRNWAWLSTIWSLLIAYAAGVVCYQLFTFAKHPLMSLLWIIGMLALMGAFAGLLKRLKFSTVQSAKPLMGVTQCSH